MNSLSELKSLILERGHKIKEFSGWYLIVGKDRYTMLDGEFYLNKERIAKKDLSSRFKDKAVKEDKVKPVKIKKK